MISPNRFTVEIWLCNVSVVGGGGVTHCNENEKIKSTEVYVLLFTKKQTLFIISYNFIFTYFIFYGISPANLK